MKNKKLVFTIIDAVLLVAGIVFNSIGLVNGGLQAIQLICNLVAILAGIVYLVLGYKKEAHLFFKIFIGFLFLKELFAMVHIAAYETITLAGTIVALLCYTCPVMLANKDLGAKKSYIIGGVYAFLSLESFASCIELAGASLIEPATATALLIYNGTRLILAVVLLLMIIAKYQDKKERGAQ